jgi:hypothetical protein
MPMTDEEWERERAKLEDETWSRYQRIFPKHHVPLGDAAKLPNQVMVGEAGTGMKNGDSLV